MKYKFILSSRYIEYEDACLEQFNKMNEQGYILKSIGIFFVFEKSDRKVKYQIDYTTRDTEYNSIIEDQGYVYIGSCNKVHYYYNENLNSLDLNTDLEVKKEVLLKKYSVSSMVILAIIVIIAACISLYNLPSFFENPIKRYYSFNNFVMCLLLLYIAILSAVYIKYISKIRNAISNNVYTYQNFKKVNLFWNIALMIQFVLMLVAAKIVTNSFVEFIFIFHITIITFCANFFRNRFVEPVGKKTYRKLLEIGIFVLIFISTFALTNLRMEYQAPLPFDHKEFPSEHVVNIDQNVVLLDVFAITDYIVDDMADFEMSTYYTECRNEDICNELFNRFLDINPNKKVNSNVVSECYEYLDQQNYYIFKSGTILVRFEERDLNNLDYRISQFINFFNTHKQF